MLRVMVLVTATAATGCSLFLAGGDGSEADAGADADVADAAPRCTPGDKRVFVTSDVYPVMSPDLADDACQEHAEGGDWRAWLSTAGEDAIERIAGDGPWCLMDRSAVVFENELALDGVPRVSIDMFEDGRRFRAGDAETGVWTGTRLGGHAADEHCASWSSTEPTEEGRLGRLDSRAAPWTDHHAVGCGSQLRFYCFEQ